MQKLMKRFSRTILAVIAALNLALPMAVPAFVHAQGDIEAGLCEGIELEVGAACESPEDAEGRVQGIIELVINIFSLVVGIVAVIMIIVGGLKYITSGGDSGNVTGAKNTILYAVIGLVVVALAQFIVRFVLNRATTAGDKI